MNLSVEQQFILCCAKINRSVDAKAKLQELLRCPISWEKVIQIASGAGLSALIYHKLNNVVDCDIVPQPVMEKLHQVYQSNGIRNLLLYQESHYGVEYVQAYEDVKRTLDVLEAKHLVVRKNNIGPKGGDIE